MDADASSAWVSEHRKKRRRRDSRTPLSAKLFIDERAKGDAASISQDLCDELFGGPPPLESSNDDGTRYIAITPWLPLRSHAEETLPWTILPVRFQDTSSDASCVSVPASSLSLQSFGAALRAMKGDIRTRSGFDVLVVDVQPIALSSVFVKIDGDALRKHEEVQRKFGGGFLASQKQTLYTKGKGRTVSNKSSVEDTSSLGGSQGSAAPAKDLNARLVEATRTSLAAHQVVHANDQLSIPLPAHPITHVPFPPVELVICEPLAQGLIGEDTEIVLDLGAQAHAHTKSAPSSDRSNSSSYLRNSRTLKQLIAEEDEDTANDSFYSAAENGDGPETSPEDANAQSSEEQASSADDTNDSEDDDATTDDSGDEMISLSSPMLGQSSGIMSARTAATPRPHSMLASGMRTPGSVFSNHTVTTARPGGLSGKSFQLKPLCAKVPDGLLHPRPSPNEDDEARVFVDIKVLARLGCFSGDWVKLTASMEQIGYKSWSFNDLDNDEAPEEFRVAKIYGLPDVPGNEPIQYPKTGHSRRFSLSSVASLTRPPPSAYVPPALFSNLGQPHSIYISALSLTSHDGKRFFRSKLVNSAAPPLAKELTLLRVPTPVSLERTAQAGLFASLKQHFERRRRLLRSGDLIAVSFQPNVSRALYNSGTEGSDPDNIVEEFLAATEQAQSEPDSDTAVAWFKVGQIVVGEIDRDDPINDEALWGKMVLIEPMETKMSQVGRECQKLPATLDVPWPFYYGSRRSPQFSKAVSAISSPESLPRPFISPVRRRLRELLAASSNPQSKALGLGATVILLHSTHRHIGKSFLASTACADLGLHITPIEAYEILSEGASGGDVKTDGTLRARLERALDCGADVSIPIIQHIEALTAERTATTISELLSTMRCLILTTTDIDKVSEPIRSLVTHEIQVNAPDEGEREGILGDLVSDRSLSLSYDVELSAIALKTAALVAGDLIDVVERASIARQDRLETLCKQNDDILLRDIFVSGGTNARSVIKSDFDSAVEAARKNFADSIGAPKIPNVTWDDVGGLASVKDAVMETIQLPLERPELFAKGMKKRSGILFYGPPGTGKTLLAKAIATEFSLNFFSVKGPELLNMYIGESEANVRRVFQKARDARPCVVFFDELDSVAPKRGNQGDSGGVMDRIVSQLLAELDGMSSGDDGTDSKSGSGGNGGSGGVFVIGATNRPDLLDQALLRPGRFDKMLYLGVADTHDKQLTILEALTRKFALHSETNLRRVAETLPFTYTGADMYALCSDAMLKAIMRRASTVDAKIKALPDGPVTTAYFFDHLAEPEDTEVEVMERDFDAAKKELVASVSAKELEHYQRVRQLFEGNTTPANIQSQAQVQSPTGYESSQMDNRPPLSISNGTATTSSRTSSRSFSLASTNTDQDALQTPTLANHPENARPGAPLRQVTAMKTNAAAKGKGKATVPIDDETEDDEEAYVTSNDYEAGEYGDFNGTISKGKGKAKVPMHGFGNSAGDDEESDLYG